jgi:hypothetical protein
VVMTMLSVVGTGPPRCCGSVVTSFWPVWILAGLEEVRVGGPVHALRELTVCAGLALPIIGGLSRWLVGTLGSGLVGLILGLLYLCPRKH